jgi:4-hydroxythreonine-4-phosphate dehydrogenase
MGDPAGISTEITLLAWMKRLEYKLPPFFVLSHKTLLERVSMNLGWKCSVEVIATPQEAIDVFRHALPVLELPKDLDVTTEATKLTNAEMTIQSISNAVEFVQNGKASSIVTNPINKQVLYQAGFTFPGHTEYLANLAAHSGKAIMRPVMMLVSRELKTVPLTIHIPLRMVPQSITEKLIVETGQIVSDDMKKYFGLKSPRLAFAGLNPHAGEGGSIGSLEKEIIEPALSVLTARGVNASGPYPADTLFHATARKNYDVVIGMYHDQALIPIKTLAFDEGVNTTLGLPFVRTSPDHGTAYDIAGKGIANPTSLIEAIKLAQGMSLRASARADYD